GAAFGVAYGGVMPLYAIITREYFGETIMGSAYGAVFLVSTIGMGLGSVAGGAIYDHLGSYFWLYLGSGSIGVAASLLALTLPPRSPAPPSPPEGDAEGPQSLTLVDERWYARVARSVMALTRQRSALSPCPRRRAGNRAGNRACYPVQAATQFKEEGGMGPDAMNRRGFIKVSPPAAAI